MLDLPLVTKPQSPVLLSGWREPRTLVSPELFPILAARLQRELTEKGEVVSHEEAERRMEASLGFLQLRRFAGGRRFSPTPAVDAGWHVFLMYTQEYTRFSRRVMGKFIHHRPSDTPDSKGDAPPSPAETVAFMKVNGIPFAADLWQAATTDCGGPDSQATATTCESPRHPMSADCDAGCGSCFASCE